MVPVKSPQAHERVDAFASLNALMNRHSSSDATGPSERASATTNLGSARRTGPFAFQSPRIFGRFRLGGFNRPASTVGYRLTERAVARYVDHEQRRIVVVDAATALVIRDGRSALTVRSVAEEIGCSTKVVSHYFADTAE